MSGGEDRHGQIYVSLHDRVFEKSDNYHHIASSIWMLRNKCIANPVSDRVLSDEVEGVNYNDLNAFQKDIVQAAMQYATKLMMVVVITTLTSRTCLLTLVAALFLGVIYTSFTVDVLDTPI